MKKNIKLIIFGVLTVAAAVFIVAMLLGKPVQVVIDPGHGGSDVGAEYNGRNEKDDNLALALLVNDYLNDMGVDSVLTRSTDKKLSLKRRCQIANIRQADLFVSLHRNSAQGAKGVEIWVGSEAGAKDKELADNILQMLSDAGISKSRGVKSGYARGDGDYYVNSHSDMPSCLVELGFINSDEDNRLFDEKLDEYAKAIAVAVKKSLPGE